VSTDQSPSEESGSSVDGHRLPRCVIPHHYDIVWEPDLASSTFAGTVHIFGQVTEPTETVTLHSAGLTIDSARITADGTTTNATAEVIEDLEQLRLSIGSPIVVGPIEIELSFHAPFNEQLVGLYRSTAVIDGAEQPVAVTQFESTHARRAVPCFDEPDFKATFGVTAVIDSDLVAVSNSAETGRSNTSDGRLRIEFANTISMSTYLVALVVGPFEATPPRQVACRNGNLPLRVVHLPGQGHLCEFALDAAESALLWFEDYYDLPYPGDKVDLVAVPDFAFGAMENLGCITFREVLLLVDPTKATRPELQRIADVVAHELAHMWFGDLVTMRWWNGIWLNEAFATFMEIMASDHFRPDWDVWTTFGLARTEAFDTDSLTSTRPIEYPVITAADAEGMFDILTYEKGASVVRMLEHYVGAEEFSAGIALYLRRHAFGNTETADLWDALEESTGEPVRRIMDEWIFNGGFPVVSVVTDGSHIHIDQRRATFRPTNHTAVSEPRRWPIPMVVTIGRADGTEHIERLLLDDPMTIDAGGEVDWVAANTAGAGFYRVEPSADVRLKLALASRPPVERFGLIDDTYAAVVAGTVDANELIELLRVAAPAEDDPAIWRRIARVLRDIHTLSGPQNHAIVEELIQFTAAPTLARAEERLATEPTDARAAELREITFAVLGGPGADPEIRRTARSLWTDDSDPALQAAAISVVAASASAGEFERLEANWRAAVSPQDEMRYLHALADTDEPDLFDRTLELAITEVRSQNAPYLLRRMITHPQLGEQAWNRIERDWDALVERLAAVSVARMLEGIRAVTDESLADRIVAVIADRPLAVAGRQVEQHVERMRVNVATAAAVRTSLAAN